MQPAHCLVTGVAGFIGSHLAERLLDQGHTVLGIDCFTDYYPHAVKERNLTALRTHPKFTFLQADLLDLDLARVLAGENERLPSGGSHRAAAGAPVSYVFHLAAQAGVRASWGASFEVYTRNNILVTQRLLEAARGARLRKFVYASSSSIYGDAEAFPTPEHLTPHPISPYGVSKLAAEHLCFLYWRNYRLPAVALRYFTVYGPRQRPDMAFHKFISAMRQQQPFTVFGDGDQTRDFTYVADAVDGTIAAAAADVVGEAFNLGGGSRVTVKHVIARLEDLTGEKAQVQFIEEQKGDVRHTAADTTRARELLGYRPSLGLEEGLRREVAWMQSEVLQPHFAKSAAERRDRS